MAFKSILGNKGRSFLTMLGIIIGIASVMTIVSTVNGMNQESMKQFEAMGTNKINVSAMRYDGQDVFDDLYDYCSSLGSDLVLGITPNANLWDLTVVYGSKSSKAMEKNQENMWNGDGTMNNDLALPPECYLGSDQYAVCNNFQLAKGRDISNIDIKNYNQVCVLGARAAKNIGLMLQQGQEVEANTAVITIADTSTIVVDATVDERNVSYVKPGMMVDIDQWGSTYMGTVESVSLNSKAENGVASYPMVITVDNYDGTLMTGSYVNYSLVASENDNCLVVPIQCVWTVPLEDGSTGDVVFVKGDRPDNAIDLTVPVDGVPDGFWAVPVEIGISDTYNVEIKSGVEEGTEVFTQRQTSDVWM